MTVLRWSRNHGLRRWRVEQIPPVRIGLIGYGKGGRFFHAPLIAGATGCELAGVVTRSAERRAEVERDSPRTPASDARAHLAAAEPTTGAARLDAVAISPPANTHVPLSLEAISL